MPKWHAGHYRRRDTTDHKRCLSHAQYMHSPTSGWTDKGKSGRKAPKCTGVRSLQTYLAQEVGLLDVRRKGTPLLKGYLQWE